MSNEQIRIPDLPPTSTDFNTFITGLNDGGVKLDELPYRFQAFDGFAQSQLGDYVFRDANGELGFTEKRVSSAIRETRTISPVQQEVILELGNRLESYRSTELTLDDATSFLRDILTSRVPFDELPYRFQAFDGFAQSQSGDYVFRDGKGELRFGENLVSGAIRETRTVTPQLELVIISVANKIETFKGIPVTSTEAAEKARGGDIAARKLQSLGSYLQGLNDGAIKPDELPYRFQAFDGFAQSQLGDYVFRDAKGELSFTEKRVSSAIRETRTISPEQEKVVTFLAINIAERNVLASARKTGDLAQFAITNARSNEDVATKARGIDVNDAFIPDLQALYNLSGSVNDPSTNERICEYFKTGDDATILDLIGQKRMELVDLSDASNVMSGLNTLETYVQTARRIGLRSRFWQSTQENGFDPATGLDMLNSYEIVDDGDRALVSTLRTEGLKLRRDLRITQVTQMLGDALPDFARIADLLADAELTVNSLRDEQGLEVLNIITESAFITEVNEYFRELIAQFDVDRIQIADVLEMLEDAPIRPNIAGVDFFEEFSSAKGRFLEIAELLDTVAEQRDLLALRKRFINDPDVQGLAEDIMMLPDTDQEDMELRQALLDELALFVSAQRGNDPARFGRLQNLIVDGIRSARADRIAPLDLTARPGKRNIAAVRNVVGRFQQSIMPLFEAVRGGNGGEVLVKGYTAGGANAPRDRYVQLTSQLEKQRPISEIERAYLESVELLSLFNPHLVALAQERPELTSLYLENYFMDLDAEVKNQLQADVYVPLVQIGLGPQGLAAAGELARSNPELSSQALFIDVQALPGGPFGVAKGPSWELNSASALGLSTNVLPDQTPAEKEGVAVRSYGSPLVSYPGERKEGVDVRLGSINATVDYLLNPDNISSRRYPTNVDIARVLQLQAAMLVDQVLLSTRVIGVEPVQDGQPGNKRITVEYTGASGERVINTIRTDAVIISSGLGEPNLGIELQGSSAEQILKSTNTRADGFPLLTDTIGAFEELSNPENEPIAPKGIVVIYGSGNSTDVLIEYFGRQFESGNPQLNGISKVVVVAQGELSKRPRYAQINDLKSRNGKQNFLEIIEERVTDVVQEADGRLSLLNQNGARIQIGRNGGAQELRADHVIAATGFRPMLDNVFGSLLSPGESLDRRRGLGRVSLPNNPGFSIADELINDPSVLVVGTASRADFENPNKLGQLPAAARDALIKNGAENAVAIGFRAPDTRAAVRLKFAGQEVANKGQIVISRNTATMDVSNASLVKSANRLPIGNLPKTRRTVEADSDTLTALFLGSLPKLRLSEDIDASYAFRIMIDESSRSFEIRTELNDGIRFAPQDLVAIVEQAAANPYFQAYILKATKSRRSASGVEIKLSFSNGRLRLRDKPDSADQQRTYVEVV